MQKESRQIPIVGKYNLPSGSQVSALIPCEESGNLDVVLHYKNGSVDRISSLHRSYDPLHYVLLFPFGTDGWQTDSSSTQLRFHCHRLQIRENSLNTIMRSRRLMQQFAVDQWGKIECSRMHWVRTHQSSIRAK